MDESRVGLGDTGAFPDVPIDRMLNNCLGHCQHIVATWMVLGRQGEKRKKRASIYNEVAIEMHLYLCFDNLKKYFA